MTGALFSQFCIFGTRALPIELNGWPHAQLQHVLEAKDVLSGQIGLDAKDLAVSLSPNSTQRIRTHGSYLTGDSHVLAKSSE